MRLILRTQDGALLDLPASLEVITTYVILEQERWFERHLDFLLAWLRSDMTVIDIGANVGVYAMPMAKRVRRIYAYEPGSTARNHLERSRLLNDAANLQIGPQALSDAPRRGHLTHGGSSELNRLGESNSSSGEPVEITCLDEQDRLHHWSPDFVKIDAEFEEPRIIAGGTSFFRRHSPLVMFEIAAPVPDLMAAFASLGYRTYRALPSRPLLVPHDSPDDHDDYEGNLFAVKPDRAQELAAKGLLIDDAPPFLPDASAREQALSFLFAQPFGALLRSLGAAVDPAYRDALAGYAVWRQSGNHAALDFALRQLIELCANAPSLPRLSTLSRIAWEAGRRRISAETVQGLHARLSNDPFTEPFWPASPRFDTIAPDAQSFSDWFVASALEHKERTAFASSCFGSTRLDLERLGNQPFSATEITRRHVLQELRAGRPVEIPDRLLKPAADHINAEVWRSGIVQTLGAN